MLSVALFHSNGYSVASVNNAVSATPWRGRISTLKALEARTTTRVGEGRGKGGDHVSERDMLTAGIADAPMSVLSQNKRQSQSEVNDPMESHWQLHIVNEELC